MKIKGKRGVRSFACGIVLLEGHKNLRLVG